MSAPTTSLSSTELRDRLNSNTPPRLLDNRTESYDAAQYVARLGEA